MSTIDSDDFALITPVPVDAPAPPSTFKGIACSDVYRYKDAAGATLFLICRFNKPGGGKDVVPLSLWRSPDGQSLEWRFKAHPAPRPLYGLNLLAARPDAIVLVAEGEKATKAARILVPNLVCMTSSSGAKSAAKSDWSPLVGRSVVIWPDADEPGSTYAADVARLAHKAGATAIQFVDLATISAIRGKGDLPSGWDAADALEEKSLPANVLDRAGVVVDWVPRPEAEQTENTKAADIDPRRIIDPPDAFRTARQMIELEFTTPAGLATLRHLSGEFFHHKGTRYESIPADLVRSKVYHFLETCFVEAKEELSPIKVNATRVSSVVDALRARVQAIGNGMPCWLDAELVNRPLPSNVIAFQNGLLDVNAWVRDPVAGTTLLIPHTPSWFSVNVLPYDFSPDAACPVWLEFLADVFDGNDEMIMALQQWMGYLLVPDTSQHKIALLIGPARAGKGVIMRVIGEVLGDFNCCAPTLSRIGSEFGLFTLLGKLAALCGDAHLGKSSDRTSILESLKKISGEDPVDVNRKYLPQLCGVRLPVRFTIALNEMLNLPDASAALAARLIVFPFTKSYLGKEQIGLDRVLIGEVAGICRWALDGLCALRLSGKLLVPKDGKDLQNEIARMSSPVLAFTQERCNITQTSDEIECKSLYHVWKKWCEHNGHEAGSIQTFGSKLRAVNPGIKRVRQRNAGSLRAWAYRGIVLREE